MLNRCSNFRLTGSGWGRGRGRAWRFQVVLALILLAWPSLAQALYQDLSWGEPYAAPAGKRIVFTTWYWVVPGQPIWIDDEGKEVTASGTVAAGPFDSHYDPLEAPYGIRLIAEPALRSELVIAPEFPWETGGIQISQLLQTEDKIMAWGHCIPGGACYFESTDGITWERPKLGLRDYDGNKENNLTPGNPPGAVFLDPNAPPEERFKAADDAEIPASRIDFKTYDRPWSVMATELTSDAIHVIHGFVSPDGIRWTQIPEPIGVDYSDGDQIVYFDPLLEKYVMYLRTHWIGPRAKGYPKPSGERHKLSTTTRRSIGRTESDTFRAFPPSEVVIQTGNDMPPNDTFYLQCRTTIPLAPDHHLMFPSRYIQSEDSTAMDLFTSWDGRIWDRAPGSPLLRPANFGQWNGGSIFIYPNLVELGEGDWVIPYHGHSYPHKYPRGLARYRWGVARWPKGRMMALEAPEQGAFSTLTFLAPERKLIVNALTNRVGEILVEAVDYDGNPIEGRTFEDSIPIVGDQFRAPVRWKNAEDLGVEAGQPVALRFRLKKAKIYCLDFE